MAPATVIALVVAFALAAVPASADPTVASKRAEAQSVLGQIQQLDSSLERAVEAYNLANVKLTRIKHDLSSEAGAEAALVAARRPLHLRGPGFRSRGAARLLEPRRHAQPHGRGRPRLAAGLARPAPGRALPPRGATAAAAPPVRAQRAGSGRLRARRRSILDPEPARSAPGAA